MKVFLFAVLGWFSAGIALAQSTTPIAPLPTKAPTTVTSTTATPPTVGAPTAPAAPAAPTVASSVDLVGVLKEVATIGKNGVTAADVAAKIGPQLPGLDIQQELGKLGSITGINGQVNLGDLGSVLNASKTGDLQTGLSSVFKELEGAYKMPGLSAAKQAEIYKGLVGLREVMANAKPLDAALGKAKAGVTDMLSKAGLGSVVGALDKLAKGTGDPVDLAKALANTDLTKLNATLTKLGLVDEGALKNFLPKGVTPAMLTTALDLFKKGGVDKLLTGLQGKLKDKLKNALPKEAAVLKGLLGKLNASAGLGKLLGNIFKPKKKAPQNTPAATAAAKVAANAALKGVLPEIPAVDCTFKGISQRDSAKIDPLLIENCKEMGFPPPRHWLNKGGTEIAATSVGRAIKLGGCGPDGTCLNTARERVTKFAGGYDPSQNSNLAGKETAWKDITRVKLPCGAVASIAKLAMQALWKNVKINIPANATSLVNSAVSGLVSSLSKKKDCSKGSFWGVLNTLVGLVMPSINANKPNFRLDLRRNTFMTPPNALLTFPNKTTFTVDLSAGNAQFTLPIGGKVTGANGRAYKIPANSTVQIQSNGSIITTAGQYYSVAPGSMVTLDPRGVVSLPTPTELPISPDATVFPMQPNNAKPDWAR